MKYVLMIVSVLALSACGIDGAPVTPSANLGLSITPNGIQPTATIGANKGPLGISLNL